MRFIHPFVLLFVFLIQPAFASEQPFNIKKLAGNLGVVWGMDFVDSNRIIFTQREGKAGLLDLSNNQVTWLSGVPEVHAEGQGGLLDVAIPPDYAKSGWIYFTYSKPDLLQAQTTLARAKLHNTSLIDWQDLLVSDSASFRNIHFGSRIAFDGKGHVFFSIGDRGERSNAQDLTNHAGSIICLNMDGSVPKDNPFVGNTKARDEIWSYGHRNPQGLYYDLKTDRLWEIEHGPQGGDEINLIKKGKNYGWPIVSQGKEYFSSIDVGVNHKPGMEEPVKVYIPSIAPSDLQVYHGTEFKDWEGNLLTGALKLQHLNRITLNDKLQAVSESRYLQNLNQRIRSLAVDEIGRIYVGTDSGNIYRLTNSDKH
ncbi:PQQ-dependent sugar dehydrogenase [Thiomicrorhabdus sp. ZW0627]|uniref:PQQ-dependent sugar dehydrogenase n=1 Tax=Thiomicrorhabdus sp. ZW0627 TaxID=3039774 RepID=UPI0024363122|nr:PQQ-dependent sugar dehydrogenase [Thiomicrorhabdus sp. ZW0627]MDG6772855.1 PQQ-dependent sugar dehydrogenase [Thiomicrorhabdus sp. ZW0627]